MRFRWYGDFEVHVERKVNNLGSEWAATRVSKGRWLVLETATRSQEPRKLTFKKIFK